jgi:predicted TIM-barrel fold metal-dependent hydrolase
MRFIAESKGHATLCTTFDPFQFNSPNFSRSAIEALNHDFDQGAVAAKVWKNIGMEVKNASGEYVLADDLVFQPIYSDIAARGKTLIIHAADPDGAWDPQARIFRNKGYFDANPQWDMSKVPTAPRKESILHARDHMLAVNPGLRVVGAHLGSMETQLDALAQLLDRYPNFAIDTAARVRHLATQPRDKVRAFLLKYQDRVLYGTDLSFDVGSIKSEEETSRAWEAQYALDWRYFATNDTFQYMGREVEGLDLSPSILKQLYHDNALRWIPGISTNVP